MAQYARELGVTLVEHCPFRRFLTQPEDGHVTGIECEDGRRFDAEFVIIASGMFVRERRAGGGSEGRGVVDSFVRGSMCV